jgi:hypothetical protein
MSARSSLVLEKPVSTMTQSDRNSSLIASYSPKPQPIEAAGVFRSNILSHGLKQNTTEYLKLHVDNQNDDRPETASSPGTSLGRVVSR